MDTFGNPAQHARLLEKHVMGHVYNHWRVVITRRTTSMDEVFYRALYRYRAAITHALGDVL